MPTYEYRCAACASHHDLVQKMSDPPATKCPACGKDALERLISASAFALKGSGWYADGYGAKPSEAPKAGAAKATPAKTEAPAAEAPKTEAPKAEPAKADAPKPSS